MYNSSSNYGVHIYQLIRYSRTCGSYQDFRDRRLLLTSKLLTFPVSWSCFGCNHALFNRYGDICHIWPRTCSICRSHNPLSWFITGYLTRETRGVQEIHTLTEHTRSPLGFKWCLCCSIFDFLCFVDYSLSLYSFPFDYCIFFSSYNNGFCLHLLCLQTFHA